MSIRRDTGAVQSAGNTSTTPLSGSATFTGAGEYVTQSDVMCVCKTDAAGTLYFDFSPDGTNWDSTFPVNGFAVAAGINEFHTAVKGPRYFRVRLVNGSAAQSYLRLYVYYGDFRQGNLPIGAGISADADATVVRSISADLDLALGRVGGQREDRKFGEVEALDPADAPADIWQFATDTLTTRTALKNWPASAATLYMSSDSASDTDLDLTVTYIDSTGAAVDLDYNYTAGTTGASLGVAGKDINRVVITGATLNVGNLYFAQTNTWTSGAPSTPGDVIAFVKAAYGQTLQAAYTVPAGKIVRVKRLNVYLARSSGAAGSAEVHFLVRKTGGAWIVKRSMHVTSSSQINRPEAGLVYGAGTQMRLYAADISDLDTNLTGEWIFDEADV